jgi:hypothetical protein
MRKQAAESGRWNTAVLLALAAGCGRLNFDPHGAPTADAMQPDAVGDSPRYVLGVAACIPTTGMPDPDLCEQNTGGAGMIEISVANTAYVPARETAVFLRFDPVGDFTGRTITKTTLTMRVTDTGTETGDDSGELWTVTCFSYSDLFATAPMRDSMLLPSQGSVPVGRDAIWDLTDSRITDQGLPVCLGLYAVDPDNTKFDNGTLQNPPQLLIEYL